MLRLITQFDIASMTLKRSVNDNGFHLISKRTKGFGFVFFMSFMNCFLSTDFSPGLFHP